MGLDSDPYRDEDGEPLMDPDDDGEDSPVRGGGFDDDDEDDWEADAEAESLGYDPDKVGASKPPAFDPDKVGGGGKPRKRLVKKGGKEDTPPPPSPGGLEDDWMDDVPDEEEVEVETPVKAKKRKSPEGGKEKRKSLSKASSSSGKAGKANGKGHGGGSADVDDDGEEEIRELWETLGGYESENDGEVVRTADDDAFIDDSGVDPSNRFGSDNEAEFARNAPQAEEGEEDDDDVSKLFKGGKKKKKAEKSPAELALIVERLMAELEVTAEEDAALNRENKPAINKLKKLPLLTNVLSKKNLQQEFLDHGILTVLKNWLEPLPDGSFPNMNVRTAILKLLADLPIDLDQYDRKEQLKKSGLGRVIMFLSKSDEETTSNRKLAKELVDKWSRPIFNKSTRFEDMRSFDDEKAPYRRPTMKRPVAKSAGLESRDDDLDLSSRGQKSGQASTVRKFTSRPDALPLDFIVRPQSKIDPDEIRARAKNVVQDQRRLKMNKKLQQLKAPKKKQLQASKPSVEGRGMVKYL